MTITYSDQINANQDKIIACFQESFAASEGPEEGALIAGLAGLLVQQVDATDRIPAIARSKGAVIGAAIFTPMRYAQDQRRVYLLSPVAVLPRAQGQGVGQAMLGFGLGQLKAIGADFAITYGDPNYYSKLGFAPVTVEEVPAPYPLSYPHGWQAMQLSKNATLPLVGAPSVVAPFRDPSLW